MFSEQPQYPVYHCLKNKRAPSLLQLLQNNLEEQVTFNGVVILATKKTRNRKSSEWKICSQKVVPFKVNQCRLKKNSALLYLNSLRQPESKLEKEWAVWLERPWADSWASVFGCTWQDNSVVSQGLWRTHSQILYTPPRSHKVRLLPSNLGFPSQLRVLRPTSTTHADGSAQSRLLTCVLLASLAFKERLALPHCHATENDFQGKDKTHSKKSKHRSKVYMLK